MAAISLQNVVTGDNLSAVTDLVTTVVGGIINFFYSFISVIVWVITKAEVLSALAVIFIMFWAYRTFRNKVGSGIL